MLFNFLIYIALLCVTWSKVVTEHAALFQSKISATVRNKQEDPLEDYVRVLTAEPRTS